MDGWGREPFYNQPSVEESAPFGYDLLTYKGLSFFLHHLNDFFAEEDSVGSICSSNLLKLRCQTPEFKLPT